MDRIDDRPPTKCVFVVFDLSLQLFLRGKPQLQKFMRRLPKTHKKLPMKKDDEPDFYSMDKANPLPSLDECSQSQGLSMNQIRQQHCLISGSNVVQNQVPMNMGPNMGGISAFETRDPLMGIMGHQRSQNSLPGGNCMSMNNMSPMGSMSGLNIMNTMGSMNSMGTMNGLNGLGHLNGMNQMNSLNGMNSLLDSSNFGNSGDTTGELQLQRLRQMQQMQQMQLFERQMNGTVSSGTGLGNDTLSMNFMLNRQQC